MSWIVSPIVKQCPTNITLTLQAFTTTLASLIDPKRPKKAVIGVLHYGCIRPIAHPFHLTTFRTGSGFDVVNVRVGTWQNN